MGSVYIYRQLLTVHSKQILLYFFSFNEIFLHSRWSVDVNRPGSGDVRHVVIRYREGVSF